MNRRLRDGLIGGVLLGIVCVIGAYVRSGGTADINFVFALWYNRVIMGLVVGAPWPKLERNKAMMTSSRKTSKKRMFCGKPSIMLIVKI